MKIILLLLCFVMKSDANELQLHVSREQKAAYFRDANNVVRFNHDFPLKVAEQKARIESIGVQIVNYPDYQSFRDAMWLDFERNVTNHYEHLFGEHKELLWTLQEWKWKYDASAYKYYMLREYETRLRKYVDDVSQLPDKNKEIIEGTMQVMEKEVVASPSYYGGEHDEKHLLAIQEMTEKYKDKAYALLQR